ncbi:MAG: cyclic-di-AMP receptor [Anaerolineae bacterium]|nr:cyclic-di-AMP receptor [Anaerolineae bacterium]
MKLIIAIVRDVDAGPVVDQLIAHHYRVTRVASTGGFLRRGNVTLLIGAEEQKVRPIIALLREACSPPDPNHHRATIFVVNAPHFEQV